MRTDRTMLCGYCCVRFPPSKICPECGKKRVYDLTVGKSRRNGMKMVRRHQGRGPAESVPLLWCVVGAPIMIIVVAVVTLSFPAALLAALISYLLGAPLAAIAGNIVWERLATDGPTHHIRLLEPPVANPAAQRVTASGVVRILRPVTSPLSNQRCAAFRIVGCGPTGTIDEAGAGQFDVIQAVDEPIGVDGTAATVDIDVRATPKKMPRRRPIMKFLRERGACPHLHGIEIAEAVLSDGDEVVVFGTPTDEVVPGAYRDAGFRRVLTDHPGSPLVIRRYDG